MALSDGHAVALDLGAVTQIDAHGAGVLAELSADAQRAGLPLSVVRAGARVRHLLRLTHLEAMMASPGEPGAIGWHPRVIIGGAPYRPADVTDDFAVSARCGVH